MWCSFTGASEEDAARFDVIFEAGLGANLEMDRLNAFAAGQRSQHEADGMAPDTRFVRYPTICSRTPTT